MKPEQVLSVEQMKHLQVLGLNTSDASMHYQFLPTSDAIINGTDEVEKEPSLFVSQPNMKHEYPTYTLQDIMELLPKEVKTDTDTYWLTISIYDCKEWYVCYSMSDEFDYYKEFRSESLLEASYNMLCWVIENGYLETNK